MAQLVEHLLAKEEVAGSSPVSRFIVKPQIPVFQVLEVFVLSSNINTQNRKEILKFFGTIYCIKNGEKGIDR